VRKIGRIVIDLLAGVLVLTAIGSWTGTPSRFFGRPVASSQEIERFLQQIPRGALPSQLPTPALPAPPTRPCQRPTMIGRVIVPSVAARTAPTFTSPVIATFPAINQDGARQVFDVGGSLRDQDGGVWYRALLPIRPNGTSGYIPADAVRVVQTQYRIAIDRHHLRLAVWSGCTKLMVLPIGLGKESTPTPDGRYYIVALLKPPIAGSVYGNYAYGLSAFSDVLKDWAGGGIIGLHGTNDPSSIGNRKSHGCIRMYNKDIAKLVPLLPLGTPVDIE
jgi:lipoprotein-anchoring transpeptidase ErfK/SrfK